MWAQNILLAVIGLSAGVIVAGGLFSFVIEFSQLLFHLGTFQISDLVYNTLGGTVGGLAYYIIYKFSIHFIIVYFYKFCIWCIKMYNVYRIYFIGRI